MLGSTHKALKDSQSHSEQFCNIGEASRRSGVSSKMIRHYEAIGILAPARRTSGNYRYYSDVDVNQLRFIKSARGLGFSIKQISSLVGLWLTSNRSNAEVKDLAMAHVRELDARIQEMQQMRSALHGLAMRCSGDGRPECPILDTLADQGHS